MGFVVNVPPCHAMTASPPVNRARPRASPRRGPPAPTPYDEVSDALGGEIARCAVRAAEQAMLLESIGSQTFAVTDEIFRAAGAGTLLQRSHAIRGLVAHALAVLTELQCVAGRLDALATIRRVASDRGASSSHEHDAPL
jgi:hypothetical protein